MRPWHHARTSARRAGRDWRDDLAIHEFLDLTKTAVPDLRHRMILHSVDLGGELAARAFPHRPEARDVAAAHVREDLGAPVTLSDWLAACHPSHLPRPVRTALPVDEEAMVEEETARQGLAASAGPRAVLELLRLPLVFAPQAGASAWSVLGNAAGPEIVRRILGSPTETEGATGRRVVFDPAWCAEGMIARLFRRIPEVRDVVFALRPSYPMELRRVHGSV